MRMDSTCFKVMQQTIIRNNRLQEKHSQRNITILTDHKMAMN